MACSNNECPDREICTCDPCNCIVTALCECISDETITKLNNGFEMANQQIGSTLFPLPYAKRA